MEAGLPAGAGADAYASAGQDWDTKNAAFNYEQEQQKNQQTFAGLAQMAMLFGLMHHKHAQQAAPRDTNPSMGEPARGMNRMSYYSPMLERLQGMSEMYKRFGGADQQGGGVTGPSGASGSIGPDGPSHAHYGGNTAPRRKEDSTPPTLTKKTKTTHYYSQNSTPPISQG